MVIIKPQPDVSDGSGSAHVLNLNPIGERGQGEDGMRGKGRARDNAGKNTRLRPGGGGPAVVRADGVSTNDDEGERS